MEWKRELKIFAWMLLAFLAFYFMPSGTETFDNAVSEAFLLLRWYAREHVVLCLIPAFFIAGVIAVFISQGAVARYLGPKAAKWKAYLVASLSGSILAVCSCTILPLFASIYKRGAGLGPAMAFLYSGPAINILAIILTARILGLELGLARIIGAVIFSVIIGLIMAMLFRKEEQKRAEDQAGFVIPKGGKPITHILMLFLSLVFILVFANWGDPGPESRVLHFIWIYKWKITAVFGFMLSGSLVFALKIQWWKVLSGTLLVILLSFIFPAEPVIPFITAIVILSILIALTPGDAREWLGESWFFTKQILPLLAAGVLIAGFLLGGPEGNGIIPEYYISSLVGGNSIMANFFASIFGAFMYFATLTEVPIIQGLLANGMGKGPALTLLLAGPALSLPNMLVIRSVIGNKKTFYYIILVIIMATISGMVFGAI
ncbi:MAG: permease [Bacteroidota bacterium]